jgi:hypothetical protein
VFAKGLSMDDRDKLLSKSFVYIINKGFTQYSAYKNNQDDENQLDESGWLKKDSNFYHLVAALVDDIIQDGDDLKPLVVADVK